MKQSKIQWTKNKYGKWEIIDLKHSRVKRHHKLSKREAFISRGLFKMGIRKGF